MSTKLSELGKGSGEKGNFDNPLVGDKNFEHMIRGEMTEKEFEQEVSGKGSVIQNDVKLLNQQGSLPKDSTDISDNHVEYVAEVENEPVKEQVKSEREVLNKTVNPESERNKTIKAYTDDIKKGTYNEKDHGDRMIIDVMSAVEEKRKEAVLKGFNDRGLKLYSDYPIMPIDKEILDGMEVKQIFTEIVKHKTSGETIRVNKIKTGLSAKEKRKLLTMKKVDKEKSKAFSKVVLPYCGLVAIFNSASIRETINLIVEEGTNPVLAKIEQFKEIFRRMVSANLPIKTHQELMDRVTIFDEEIIEFGIFNASNPEENVYPIPCDKCKTTITHTQRNEALLTGFNEAFVTRVKSLLLDPQNTDVIEDSPAYEIYELRIEIENIGEIVMYLSIPTIGKMTRRLNPEMYEQKITDKKLLAIFQYIHFIDKVIIPIDDEVSIELETDSKDDFKELLEFLSESLDMEHLELIAKKVEEMREEYTYKIGFREVKCPQCGKYTKFAEVDMQNLFLLELQQKIGNDSQEVTTTL